MAGGPIVINYSADVSEAVKGTDELGEAMSSVGDAADDSAKASGTAADTMLADRKAAAKQILDITRNQALEEAKSWKESALAAGRSAEDVEAVYQHMSQSIKESTSGMFAKLNGADSESIGSVERGIVGLRGQLVGMFQQVGISFDWSDPIGSATQALSGLAAVIPGIGGLIGAGLGQLLYGVFQNWQRDEQKAREDLAALTKDLIDTGSTGSVAIGTIVEQLEKMATETDPNAINLQKIHDQAKQLGVPFEDLAQAYAHGDDALKSQIAALKEHRDEALKAGQDYGNFGSSIVNVNSKATAGITDQIHALQAVQKQNKEAAKEAKLYEDSGAAAMARQQAAIESMAGSLSDASGDLNDFYNSQTKAFDTQGYIDKWNQLSQTIAELPQKLAASNLNEAAVNYIKTLPAEQQAAYISAYEAANPTQKDALNRIWAANGTDGGKAYTQGLQQSLPTNVAGPTITATWKVDDSALKRAIAAQTNVVIPVFISPRMGKVVY